MEMNYTKVHKAVASTIIQMETKLTLIEVNVVVKFFPIKMIANKKTDLLSSTKNDCKLLCQEFLQKK